MDDTIKIEEKRVFTPEGVEIKIGQIWLDLDTRFTPRKIQILAIDEKSGKVSAKSGTSGKVTRISIKRLKYRSSGYRLLEDEEL